MKFSTVLIGMFALMLSPLSNAQSKAPAQGQWTSTRTTSYDWVCKTMDNQVISGHNRQDTAFAACSNLTLKDGISRQVSGGIYRIEATPVVIPPEPENECPAQPADETRSQTCPAGTTGTWTQTRSYTGVPYPTCWTAGEWEPTSPPADACVTTPVTGLPTPETTGYKHTGVTLTNYTGTSTITKAGTVIDSKRITSPITINAANVKITRSLIDAGSAPEQGQLILGDAARSALVEDVEITGNCDRTIKGHIDATSTTVNVFRRVYAHGCTRGMDLTGGSYLRMEDSYMCCNSNPGSGERSHASAIRAAGGTHHMEFINVVFGVGAGSWSSGLIATYPENGANGPLTFKGGLWIIMSDNDGAYGIAAGHTPPEPTNHDYTVEDLQISTQFYSEGCPTGCAQQWNELTGTNVWRNVTKYNPGKPDHGQPIDHD